MNKDIEVVSGGRVSDASIHQKEKRKRRSLEKFISNRNLTEIFAKDIYPPTQLVCKQIGVIRKQISIICFV